MREREKVSGRRPVRTSDEDKAKVYANALDGDELAVSGYRSGGQSEAVSICKHTYAWLNIHQPKLCRTNSEE